MHGKGNKRRILVYPSDWTGRHMCLSLVWEITDAKGHGNLVVFLQSSLAIDLHEESRFIAEGISTNSISLA